jgi:hypothetical protein
MVTFKELQETGKIILKNGFWVLPEDEDKYLHTMQQIEEAFQRRRERYPEVFGD